jgi:hypothetical protein
MAKGRSSIRQKDEYQRKQPYTPRQRMAYEPCGCDPRRIPFGDDNLNVLEPGEKICDRCFTVPSVNGTCNCL